ncbi:hypothetical protein [Vreelandella jeotgali]|uniref:hypothetical protein n=1 Tax=Vreelandella jeotgali TaxID=553386 RepID=UPI00034DDFD4|nr:hypothetical protein [Halomonas jeotgali]
MERYPDIEIYLAQTPSEALNTWLADTLAAEPLVPAGKGRWRTRGVCNGQPVPVLLVDNATQHFACLWFNSDSTPWPTDRQAAHSAARALDSEVRCSTGSWQPGDDPDLFWQVLPDGSESRVHWPD